MSGRAERIVDRFPAHLEAARPGKWLGRVTTAIASELDALSAEMAAVRRAHRLGNADVRLDVMRIGALHGVVEREMAVLTRRVALTGELGRALAEAPDDAELAAALMALWPIDFAALGLGVGDLFAFSSAFSSAFSVGSPALSPPALSPPEWDPVEAARALAAMAAGSLRYVDRVEAVRRRVARIARNHHTGNGTVMALLEGAANALDLRLGRVEHSEDRFLHAAEVRDLLPLRRADGTQLPLQSEVLGLEENPLHRAETDRLPRAHAERFEVIRRGFERRRLQVRFHGWRNRTVAPRLTNMDEGRGIGYAGPPLRNGQTLVFAEDGRVRLDGDDVTSLSYAWRGACFADEDKAHPHDFVFAGGDHDRAAEFAVATPDGVLDSGFAYPHAGDPLPMPGVGIGVTRLAVFVQTAHFSHEPEASPPADVVLAIPRPAIGFFDGSVFAAEPTERYGTSMELSLSWLEREAYVVRVWLPVRFRHLDGADGASVPARVVRALDRVKAAGIDVRAQYIGEEWILGESVLGADRVDSLLDRLRPGTALWPAPSPASPPPDV